MPGTEATPFDYAMGVNQGRKAPGEGTPPHGDYIFCLGIDGESPSFEFGDEDYGEVYQDIDVSAVVLVRGILRLKKKPVEQDVRWWFAFTVDGVEVTRRTYVEPKRTRTRNDLAANVSKLEGIHRIGFRYGVEVTA